MLVNIVQKIGASKLKQKGEKTFSPWVLLLGLLCRHKCTTVFVLKLLSNKQIGV